MFEKCLKCEKNIKEEIVAHTSSIESSNQSSSMLTGGLSSGQWDSKFICPHCSAKHKVDYQNKTIKLID